MAGGDGDADGFEDEAEILVRTSDGDTRAYSPQSAAARIESLEGMLRRRGSRVARVSVDEATVAEEPPVAVFPNEPPLRHPTEDRPYTSSELTDLARHSDDPKLRAAAIRALRRVDDASARNALQEILDDPETPPELRLLAAHVIARPPHRDHLPSELIAAFQDESDPSVRRALANGVAGLRDRGAWMKEISGLLAEETDAEARAKLFRSVTRSSRDPAARAELLAIATAPGADPKERTAALWALTKGRPDKDMIAALRPLLDSADPATRAQTLRILAQDRKMPLGTLRKGLADKDPGVRATALNQGLRQIRSYRKDKKQRGAYDAAVRTAVNLATGDPDASVRRAGVNSVWHLPTKQRNQVLAAGREDQDLAVRLSAFANSPRTVAVTATQDFVGALSSPDRSLRDYAYKQLRRLHGVREPYQSGWNAKARQEAIDEISRELAE